LDLVSDKGNIVIIGCGAGSGSLGLAMVSSRANLYMNGDLSHGGRDIVNGELLLNFNMNSLLNVPPALPRLFYESMFQYWNTLRN
jgi:hypothetical protein